MTLALIAFVFMVWQGIALAAIIYSEPFPRKALGYAKPVIGIRVLATDGDKVATAQITVDGIRREAKRVGNLIIWQPEHSLSPGVHRAEVDVTFEGPWLPLTRQWEFTILPNAITEFPNLSPEQRLVLDEVNRYRSVAGIPLLEMDPALNAAATSHAKYFILHKPKGLDAHSEIPGRAGFTGVQPWERGAFFGYPFSHYYEDMHFLDDHKRAVRDWADSVYHRFPIMDPLVEHMGYGYAKQGETSVNVLQIAAMDGSVAEMTVNPNEVHSVMVYPVPGQLGVPTHWDGNEEPDPYRFFPEAKPAGYPITIQFPKQYVQSSQVYSARITDENGNEVPFWLLTEVLSNGNRDEHIAPHIALLPKEDLKSGTRYTVSVNGAVRIKGGQTLPFDKKWWFTTAGTPAQVPVPTDIAVVVNEKVLNASMAVYVVNGRSMLPFRAFFESLNADVGWDEDTKSVSAKLEDRSVYLRIGNDRGMVEGSDFLLDAVPFIMNGRSYIPIRFVSEGLGMRVAWDGASRTVYIRSGL